MLSGISNISTGDVNSSHTLSVCVHPWHHLKNHWVLEGSLIKIIGQFVQGTNSSYKYFSVSVCLIFRLAVILIMFIKHGSSNYVAWYIEPHSHGKTLRNGIPTKE